MAETTETAAPERNARKVREGLVTSNAMDKTAIVTVTDPSWSTALAGS